MKGHEYWKEVANLAHYFDRDWVHDYPEMDRFDALHELLNYHEYIIYYAKAMKVIQHTENLDAFQEQMGSLPEADHFGQACIQVAFMAFMQDITDRLTNNLMSRCEQ